MTKKTLFLAYGNPLRRDDAVGLKVLQLLQQQFNYPDCSFMTVIQPFPEMVEQIKDVELLIVFDASIELGVGEIQCKRLSGGDWTLSHPNMAHFIGPEWLLLLCEQLYEHKPDALLFAIGIEDLGYGEGLSDTVNRKLSDVVEAIHSEIQQVLEVTAHV
jgi:hydrogenase maturation protease